MAKSNSQVANRRRERWQELLRRWEASGLSQAAFCRRHGIPVWKLAWWRKRLAEASLAGRPGGRGVAPAPTFVPVKMVPAAVRPGRLELVLGCGQRLRFPADMDPATLAGIVAALEALPC